MTVPFFWARTAEDTEACGDKQTGAAAVLPRAGRLIASAAAAEASQYGTDCRSTAGPHPLMATREELSEFLASVERRAYRQAQFAVRDHDAALDIVQEAMIKLAQSYGDRPAAEWPLLFTRILQNAITDHHRRTRVRSTWVTLFSALTPADEPDADPLAVVEALAQNPGTPGAGDEVERAQVVAIIEEEVGRLPERQRQAFLLRYWEDLDVAETAAVMGCSEGSVKTHCSRATHTLARALRERGITL